MDKISILIADDHTLVRETWSFILNTDPRFSVVAESGSGEEAVELAKKLRPNIVIMDINYSVLVDDLFNGNLIIILHPLPGALSIMSLPPVR